MVGGGSTPRRLGGGAPKMRAKNGEASRYDTILHVDNDFDIILRDEIGKINIEGIVVY